MNRKTGVLFLAALFFQAATAHADSLKDALNQKYKNHVLALRTPFSSGDQKFDSEGRLLSAPAQGPWLTYGGIYVQKLDLSNDTLRLEGPRGAVGENKKTGKPVWAALSKPVRIEIHFLQPLNSLDDAENVLGRVFFLGNDSAEHLKPELRRADDRTSGETIYHVGKDNVLSPKVTYNREPEFSEEARKAGFQGTLILSVIVDKFGNVSRIRLERALGMGLDENAMEELKSWRFEPATRNGQPVAVEMHIEVSFNLYSRSPHSH
ncbi:MAG: energy transducer TonB [Candidatus Angelobacter sp.]